MAGPLDRPIRAARMEDDQQPATCDGPVGHTKTYCMAHRSQEDQDVRDPST